MIKLVKPSPLFLDSLASLPLFRGLNAGHRAALVDCCQVVACDPGGFLVSEGEPAGAFFILKQGRVKMRRMTPSGREVVLHLSSPPQMIGCKGLTAEGARYPADGIAIDPVIALRFKRDHFIQRVAQCGSVFFSLLVELNNRLSEIYALKTLGLEPAAQRIATLLLAQAFPESEHGEEAIKGEPRQIRITKSLIAAIVGTTTETAIRILSRWKKAGFIESQRGVLNIRDTGAILKISRGEKPVTAGHSAINMPANTA